MKIQRKHNIFPDDFFNPVDNAPLRTQMLFVIEKPQII